MTVYIDEIFAINLLMDGLMLWATGRLVQRQLRWWRLLLAAVLGALYGVVIFLPDWSWLSNGMIKAVCAFAMAWIGFGWHNWKTYFKTVIYLYLVSFALGGGTVALMYFFGDRIVQTWNGLVLVQVDFKLFWLIWGAVLLLGLVHLLQKSLHQKLEQAVQIVSVQVALRGKQVRLRLLVDSGNCLTDPISGKPVAVVQTKYLQSLFTAEEFTQLERSVLGNGGDVTEIIMQIPSLAGRIRLIPYQTVGYRGLLLGIRTDYLQVEQWNVQQFGTVVALSPQHFVGDNTYQGIIAPAYT